MARALLVGGLTLSSAANPTVGFVFGVIAGALSVVASVFGASTPAVRAEAAGLCVWAVAVAAASQRWLS